MKRFFATGFAIVSGISLVSCNMPSNDKKAMAKNVNPEEFLVGVPAGVPVEDGSLYEVTGLQGLISHGDSLLVQVSPIKARESRIWEGHEKKAVEAVRVLEGSGGLEAASIRVGNSLMFRVPDQSKQELRYAYFYLEGDRQSSTVRLRALCFGRKELYEPDSNCFLGYQLEDVHIEFNLDESVISSGNLEKVEEVVFSQLPVGALEPK